MASYMWTDFECNILREYYPKMGIRVAALLPGRTLKSITTKANTLGLHKVSGVSKSSESSICTGSELKALEDKFNEHNPDVSKSTTGRTLSEIEIAGQHMNQIIVESNINSGVPHLRCTGSSGNYSKDNVWSPEDIEMLKTYFPLEGSACFKRFVGRSRNSISSKARHLGLERQTENQPWEPSYYEGGVDIEVNGVQCKTPSEAAKQVNTTVSALFGYMAREKCGIEEAIKYYLSLGVVANGKWYPSRRAIQRELKCYYTTLKTYEEEYGLDEAVVRLAAIRDAKASGKWIARPGSEWDRWSRKDVAILRKYYPSMGVGVLSKLPNRSKSSITAKANRLGLQVTDEYPGFGRWTAKESALLKQGYPLVGIDIRILLPSRSSWEIRKKAQSVGLVCTGISWGVAENDLMRELLKSHSIADTASIMGVEEIVIQVMSAFPEGTYTRYKVGWTPVEDQILREWYPIEGSACSHRLYGRSVYSLVKRAHVLGLLADRPGLRHSHRMLGD